MMKRLPRVAAALMAAMICALPATTSAAAIHPAGPHPAFVSWCPPPPLGSPPITSGPVPLADAKLWFTVAAYDTATNWAPGVYRNHVFPCKIWRLPYYNSPRRWRERVFVWQLTHGWWGAFDRRGGHMVWAWRQWFTA